MKLFARQAATISPVVGSLVWVEDPEEAWLDGEIVEVKGEEIKVLCTSGKTVSAFYIIPLRKCACLSLLIMFYAEYYAQLFVVCHSALRHLK